jgi:hypothetical protein
MTARMCWKNLSSRLWAGLDAPAASVSQSYVSCRLSPVAVASNVQAWHGYELRQCHPSCPQWQRTSEVAGLKPSRTLTPPKRGDTKTVNSGYSRGILGAFKPNFWPLRSSNLVGILHHPSATATCLNIAAETSDQMWGVSHLHNY